MAVVKSKLNRTVVSNLIDIHDVQNLLGKIWLTILNWRKTRGFPYHEILGSQKSVLRFDLDQVIKWAKENDEEIDPDRLKALKIELKKRAEKDGTLERKKIKKKPK